MRRERIPDDADERMDGKSALRWWTHHDDGNEPERSEDKLEEDDAE